MLSTLFSIVASGIDMILAFLAFASVLGFLAVAAALLPFLFSYVRVYRQMRRPGVPMDGLQSASSAAAPKIGPFSP